LDDKTLKQIPALLSYATSLSKQLIGKKCNQPTVEETVKHLILLAGAVSQPSLSQSSIPASVQTTMGSVMQLLAAENFLRIIVELLSSQHEQVSIENHQVLIGADMFLQDIRIALGVFIERLPKIKQETRNQNATAIREIVKLISGLLQSGSDAVVQSALAGLKAIYITAESSEDAALAQALPIVIACVDKVIGDAGMLVSTLSLVEVAV